MSKIRSILREARVLHTGITKAVDNHIIDIEIGMQSIDMCGHASMVRGTIATRLYTIRQRLASDKASSRCYVFIEVLPSR